MPIEPLGISRATWAAVQQMATAGVNAGSSPGGASGPGGRESLILVKNTTGATLQVGHIVGLDGLIHTPASLPRGWDFYRFHKAVKPDPAKYPFAIMLAETKNDKSGHALISGVCKTTVDVKNREHQFARPVKDKMEQMESCAFGPARLLFRENDSGVSQALVQFPMGESWDWGMVLVETSAALDAFSPLGITGASSTPSGTGKDGPNAEFLSRVAVRGATPSTSHKDFVITLADSPGGSGALVPALYAGICPCLVNVDKREHPYARADGSGPLKSGFTGFARIV